MYCSFHFLLIVIKNIAKMHRRANPQRNMIYCQFWSKAHPNICHLNVRPIYQHSRHHYSDCQKASPAHP